MTLKKNSSFLSQSRTHRQTINDRLKDLSEDVYDGHYNRINAKNLQKEIDAVQELLNRIYEEYDEEMLDERPIEEREHLCPNCMNPQTLDQLTEEGCDDCGIVYNLRLTLENELTQVK